MYFNYGYNQIILRQYNEDHKLFYIFYPWATGYNFLNKSGKWEYKPYISIVYKDLLYNSRRFAIMQLKKYCPDHKQVK